MEHLLIYNWLSVCSLSKKKIFQNYLYIIWISISTKNPNLTQTSETAIVLTTLSDIRYCFYYVKIIQFHCLHNLFSNFKCFIIDYSNHLSYIIICCECGHHNFTQNHHYCNHSTSVIDVDCNNCQTLTKCVLFFFCTPSRYGNNVMAQLSPM